MAMTSESIKKRGSGRGL